MTEQNNDLSWLKTAYGVAPESLPLDASDLAGELGPDGVKELVEQHRGTSLYRGERLGQEETSNKIEQIHRLALEGGGSWAPGEPSFGDTPTTWINQEVDELLERTLKDSLLGSLDP